MRQFIGMGTGRCGTMGLVQICRAAGMPVYHEHDGYPTGESYADHIDDLVGDGYSVVGFPFLWLYHLLPSLPVVCLHRDMDGFVSSANRYFGPAHTKTALPFLGRDVDERDDSYYARYWTYAEGVMSRVKKPVLHMDVADLSGDLVKLASFLEWDAIPTCERVWNK